MLRFGSAMESLPVFHRNRGLIAEQEAARRQVEAQFKALQARVVGETETALVEYRAAHTELLWNRDNVALQEQREAQVLAGFRAGDRDRLDVAQSRLQTLAVRKTEQDALLRMQTALTALEDAVQSPLGKGLPAPPPEHTN